MVVYARAVGGLVLFGSNSLGLILLASKPSDQHTLNPLSEDVSFITPETAEWMLVSFDWPYWRNQASPGSESERVPELHFTISTVRIFSDAKEVNERRLRLMSHFIARGASVEERNMGFTALHEALISSDREALDLLLQHGADPHAIIERPGRKSDGKNAVELAAMLYGKNSEWVTAIRPRQ